MNKKTMAISAAVLCLVSITSCGNDAPSDFAVPELPDLSVSSQTDEIPTEETTVMTQKPTENISTQKKSTETTTAKSETTPPKTTETKPYDEEFSPEMSEEDQPPEQDAPQEQPSDDDSAPEPQNEPHEFLFYMGMLNRSAADVIPAIGGTPDITTAAACFSNGADSKIYRYDGLSIECYVLDGAENICCISITGGGYKIEGGFGIGTPRGDIDGYYGAGEEFGSYTVYAGSSGELDVKYDENSCAAELTFYTGV